MSRKRKGDASLKKHNKQKTRQNKNNKNQPQTIYFYINKENISHVEEPVFAVHKKPLSELLTSCEHNLFVFKIMQMQRNNNKYMHMYLFSMFWM